MSKKVMKKRAAGAKKTSTSRRGRVGAPKVTESQDARRKRMAKILARLKELYPDADCALIHNGALELLVATILSAQCTDETVNKVTPTLLARYPSAQALASAPPADIEEIIHSTGFFRQKAKSIINACKMIVEKFGGQVPDTMEALTQLPGVARKTANVLLGTWFHKNEGVVVDTHVGRLAQRLGLTWTSKDEKDAVKIERDLMQVIPRDEWTYVGHALIWHGRRVCFARKPNCAGCGINKYCPSTFTFEHNRPTKEAKLKAGRK